MKTNQNRIRRESMTDDKEFARLKEQIAASSLSYQNLQVSMITTFNEIGKRAANSNSGFNNEHPAIR